MPAMDEDDRPKKKIIHEIGQDLALLSIGELAERIALLKEEIDRLQAAIARKQGSRTVATRRSSARAETRTGRPGTRSTSSESRPQRERPRRPRRS